MDIDVYLQVDGQGGLFRLPVQATTKANIFAEGKITRADRRRSILLLLLQ
jgi:hypothetical protein